MIEWLMAQWKAVEGEFALLGLWFFIALCVMGAWCGLILIGERNVRNRIVDDKG